MIDISTPAIWYPGQTNLEFEEETQLMLVRARATSNFLYGTLDADAYLDLLDSQGFDVFGLVENCWNLPLVA